MAKDEVTVTLTREQALRLLNLVRQDARRLQYGILWTEDNQHAWPVSLKRLRTIARKLQEQLYPGRM